MLLAGNNKPNKVWDKFQLLGRRPVVNVQGKNNSPVIHSLEIMNAASREIRVPNDDLFAAQTSNSGRFNSEIFYRAHFVVDHDKIANFERAIEIDDEVVEEITQDILRRERNRDTADTESGNYRCNVFAHVIQQEDDTNDPDNDIDHEHEPA
jgi:hypothetical protein